MARRTFTMVDVTEILEHWYAGRPKVEVARSLGVDAKTVRRYVAPAEAAGMVPGGPPVTPEQWRALARQWFPQVAGTGVRQVAWREIAAHHDRIAGLLGVVPVSVIHQRLADEQGLTASVASVRRYVRAHFPEGTRAEQVRMARPPVPPGAEAQVDYGYLGLWPDPATGRRRRLWAFSMVLPYSRYLFVRPAVSMTQRAWVEAHVAAFEFFGGVPKKLTPDNLKAGVCKPDLYDPKINRGYAELARHYGCLVDPARAYHPRDKAVIEAHQRYIRSSFFAGRSWGSLAAMTADAETWCAQVAGQRRPRALEGRTVAEVFAAGEAGALLPLPEAPFEPATWSRPKVAPDAHVLTELAEIFPQVTYHIAAWSAMVADRDRGRGCKAGPGRAGGARCGVAAGDGIPVGAVSARRPGRRRGDRGLRVVRGPAGCRPFGGHAALIRHGPAAVVPVPLGSRNRVGPGDPRRGT